MITPAIVDLVDDLGIYVNASYSLLLTLEGGTGPFDLTGHTIDADIQNPTTSASIGTWTANILSALDGEAELVMEKAYTLTLPPGRFSYDLSVTSPGGERFYWMKGAVDVYPTISRP